MDELTVRMLAHASLHSGYLSANDTEQKQWADDLRDAASEITRLRGEAGVLKRLLGESRMFIKESMEDLHDLESVDACQLLINDIDAALKGAA